MVDESELRRLLPQCFAARLDDGAPCEVAVGGDAIAQQAQDGTTWEGRAQDLVVTTRVARHATRPVATLETTVRNEGEQPVSLDVVPLRLGFDVDPDEALPRLRHLNGSWHWDGCYPPRAFRVSEEAFPTHKASKRVRVGGRNAGAHTPVIELAFDGEHGMDACFVALEWPGGWELSVGFDDPSHFGEPRPRFTIEGEMSLGELTVAPGDTLTLPRIHIGGLADTSWEALDNLFRSYVAELAPPAPGGVRAPVSYDHWFGIYEHFDLDALKAQADRAAEIGCEVFCLDAAWYQCDYLYDGLGNWATPHKEKFPGGWDDVAELSAHVRGLGMQFGLWHLIQVAMPGTDGYDGRPHLYRDPTPADRYTLRHQTALDEDDVSGFAGRLLALERPEAVDYAVELLGSVFRAWNVTWTRFESLPEDGLAYNDGYNAMLDRLRAEFPDLYIEGCNGGGQRMDLATLSRVHGTWLTDHTWAPEICRFMQSGALRFWPAHLLNTAVAAERGEGDRAAGSRAILSRMVGVLSFNGDIAQWSEEATAEAARHVDVYKQTRALHERDVTFPLPQPRSVDDWDAVVFGNADDDAHLLYVFREAGAAEQTLPIDSARTWRLLLGPDDAGLDASGDGLRAHMPARSGALWIGER